MSTTIESLELEVQSSATSATSGIDALSASLSRLKNAVKGGVGLTSVANQLRNLNTALQTMGSSWQIVSPSSLDWEVSRFLPVSVISCGTSGVLCPRWGLRISPG